MPSKTILSFEIELRPPLLPTPAVNGLPLAPLGAGDILPGPAVPLDSPGKNICPTGPLLTDPQVLIPALLLAPPEPGRTRLRARHKSQQFSHWNLVGGLITGCFAVIWLLPSNGARARPVSIGNPIEAAKASIRNRAEVVYESDFGGGLDEWTRPPGSSPSWFKDRNGVVWPGRLEVYAPTRSMSDYRFEFVTSVDQALGAAFRFKDWNHYYGLEIRRSGRGSESEVQLVH